jgi:hypothetical protein
LAGAFGNNAKVLFVHFTSTFNWGRTEEVVEEAKHIAAPFKQSEFSSHKLRKRIHR